MKKILALLLVLVMVIGVFAGCGEKKEPPKNDPTTNTTPSTEDSKPIDPAEKQKLWEKVFTEGTYKFASESFEMHVGGLMFITCLTDGESAYVAISGEIEDEGKVGVALYQKDKDTAYFRQFGEEEGEEVDKWFKCIANEDGEGGFEDATDDVTSTDEFKEALNAITSVEYVETIDGLDHILIHYIASEEEEDDEENTWVKTVDMTIEIEYNGEKGQYRYYEQTDADGFTSNGTISTSAIEGFKFNDWEFDKETLTLTKGEESIKATLIENHLEEKEEEKAAVTMDVFMNPETIEIEKMSIIGEEDAMTTIEFVDCEKVEDIVKLPEITEEISEEDAVMQLVMMMFALALGGAAGGIG